MRADVHTSMTRITDLSEVGYETVRQPRVEWHTGDYVFARVTRRPSPGVTVENEEGRRVELIEGETMVSALGTRRATRGYVGGWRDVGDDGVMDVLTGGGVLGRVTSASPFESAPVEVEYEGHVAVDGDVARMRDHALSAPAGEFDTPVVLSLGTSMSSGKTMSARVMTRLLVDMGYDVGACKLAGAGTYGDALSMAAGGADPVYDFVDAGLPTTVVPERDFREAIGPVVGALQDSDLIVLEAGASPLEPYNGDVVVELIEDHVAFTLLCASDPYAVVGIQQAFGHPPDVVAGIATNTTAGIDLVEKLTDRPALNLMEEDAKPVLEQMLADALG